MKSNKFREVYLKPSQIKINDDNPRTITTEKFERLVDSLLVFPDMLDARPIITNEFYTALGGNMRAQALQRISTFDLDRVLGRLATLSDYQKLEPDERQTLAAYWQNWLDEPKVKVVIAKLAQQELRQLIIKDNASFGSWDFDELANRFEEFELEAWGVDVWQTGDNGSLWNDNESAGTTTPENKENAAEAKNGENNDITLTLHLPKEYEAAIQGYIDANTREPFERLIINELNSWRDG